LTMVSKVTIIKKNKRGGYIYVTYKVPRVWERDF